MRRARKGEEKLPGHETLRLSDKKGGRCRHSWAVVSGSGRHDCHLAAVGVAPAVGHGQHAARGVPVRGQILVGEVTTVYALATCAVSALEVPT